MATVVPAERLVENLEKDAARRPNDGEVYAQLGRAYSIWYVKGAYETNVGLLDAGKDPFTEDQAILTGFRNGQEFVEKNPTLFMRERVSTKSLERLTNSILSYKKAIQLGQTNAFVYLGLAWTQQQSGRTNAARENYKKALAASERNQPKLKQMGDLHVTVEIADYLLPLLDKVKDSEEIKRVEKARATAYSRIPMVITPIAVPMKSEPIPLRDIIDWNARVSFDLDGCGRRPWQWITTNAAWLVYQEKTAEPIVSGIQMFGNFTFWMFWRNGYAALASLDDDGNGYLEGAELRYLSLWHDRDSNGKSEPEELQKLESIGIVRLSTRHRFLSENDYVSPEGAMFRDGSIRPTYDVSLREWRE